MHGCKTGHASGAAIATGAGEEVEGAEELAAGFADSSGRSSLRSSGRPVRNSDGSACRGRRRGWSLGSGRHIMWRLWSVKAVRTRTWLASLRLQPGQAVG